MNCQCESASVLGVRHTLLEEEMMVSEFQRSTALGQRAACTPIAPTFTKLLSYILTVSPGVTGIAYSVCFL